MATAFDTITTILRQAKKPLSAEEILERAAAMGDPITGNKPKGKIRQALGHNRTYPLAGPNRYVYLPGFLAGASFRIHLAAAHVEHHQLVVGPEVAVALSPLPDNTKQHEKLRLVLTPGPEVTIVLPAISMSFANMFVPLELPDRFWGWLHTARQVGGEALILRCIDGEKQMYSVEMELEGAREAAAVAARNAEVAQAAQDVLRRSQWGIDVNNLARCLIARGVFHGEPQPDTLPEILFEQDGRFTSGIATISYHEELTPALRRLFADRFLIEQLAVQVMRGMDIANVDKIIDAQEMARAFGMPEYGEEEAPEEGLTEEGELEKEETKLAEHLYRFRVKLMWDPNIWRVIEILDNQTLDDLHYAIQDAFDWDRDHLYAFCMSGKAWDKATEIECPMGDSPPTTDEVELYELELKTKQRFLYLFDYGDELRHDVELLEILPPPVEGEFPRIAEVHGKAPPQYGSWDGDDEGYEENEEDEGD